MVRIRDNQSDRYIYGFLCFETEQTYRWTPPSYGMVKEAFAGLSSLEPYCYFDRNWPRHFSNTLLRELGYSEMAVRTHHGHHDSALDSLRRHRLEPLSLSLRAEMFKSLLKELGYA